MDIILYIIVANILLTATGFFLSKTLKKESLKKTLTVVQILMGFDVLFFILINKNEFFSGKNMKIYFPVLICFCIIMSLQLVKRNARKQ